MPEEIEKQCDSIRTPGATTGTSIAGNLYGRPAIRASCRDCQFSPVMGPLVFGQSGPLPEMTLVKLLVNNEQTIGVCQGHGVDSMDTSFPGS